MQSDTEPAEIRPHRVSNLVSASYARQVFWHRLLDRTATCPTASKIFPCTFLRS
jgi:hypothetical protein